MSKVPRSSAVVERRTMRRVIEYFAKSLKITQGHSNDTLEYGMHKSILVIHCNHTSISYRF